MYMLLEVASKASSTFHTHTYIRIPEICGRLTNREKLVRKYALNRGYALIKQGHLTTDQLVAHIYMYIVHVYACKYGFLLLDYYSLLMA